MVWVLALTPACTYHSFRRSNLPSSGELLTEWKHGAFWGLVEPAPMPVAQLCPQGFHEHGSYAQLGHALLGLLTLGIYLPHTEYVIPAVLPDTPLPDRLDPPRSNGPGPETG
jgi:hypothetical protein